jgi:hypothetical protein
MVLERLFRNKAKGEPLDIDNPYAYSNAYEDCFSCRILGMNRLKEQLAQNIRLTKWCTTQVPRLWFRSVGTPILRA